MEAGSFSDWKLSMIVWRTVVKKLHTWHMADLKDYSDVCSVSDVESSDHVLSRFIAGSFRRDDLSAWPLRTTIPPLFSSILFNRVASFAPPFSTSGTELKMYNVVGTVIEVRRISRSVYREERCHNKGGERERDVAKNFWFLKQNFQVTRLMTYLS